LPDTWIEEGKDYKLKMIGKNEKKVLINLYIIKLTNFSRNSGLKYSVN